MVKGHVSDPKNLVHALLTFKNNDDCCRDGCKNCGMAIHCNELIIFLEAIVFFYIFNDKDHFFDIRNNQHTDCMDSLPKVAVVEDHSFYKKGLCFTLKHFKFVEFAFDASNGEEFLEKQGKDPADIVIMDIMMPVMGGYDTVVALKKDFPNTKVVILTMLEDDEYIQQFVHAGVYGYLSKRIDAKGLETALKAVINGNHYYSEEIMGFFARKLCDESEKPGAIKLTKRESEILELIYQGYSNQEIADKLFISVRTVTNHRFNLNVKTDTRNAVSLIQYGIKNKLLKSPVN